MYMEISSGTTSNMNMIPNQTQKWWSNVPVAQKLLMFFPKQNTDHHRPKKTKTIWLASRQPLQRQATQANGIRIEDLMLGAHAVRWGFCPLSLNGLKGECHCVFTVSKHLEHWAWTRSCGASPFSNVFLLFKWLTQSFWVHNKFDLRAFWSYLSFKTHLILFLAHVRGVACSMFWRQFGDIKP